MSKIIKPEYFLHGTHIAFEEDVVRTKPDRKDCRNRKIGDASFGGYDEQLAYAYTMKDGDAMNVGKGLDIPVAIMDNAGDYDEFKASRQPVGEIHKLPPDTYVPTLNHLGEPTGEWYSPVDIPFDRKKSILVGSIDEIMAKGVQIFGFTEGFSEKEWRARLELTADPDNELSSEESGLNYFSLIKELIDEGKITHINAQARIEPIDLDQTIKGAKVKILEQQGMEAILNGVDISTAISGGEETSGAESEERGSQVERLAARQSRSPEGRG